MALAPKKPLNPLSWNIPITNKDGTPTNEFMRKWISQIAINGGIPDTPEKLSALLDLLGMDQGDIIYRGATLWTVLEAGTARALLTTEGPGADPDWVGLSAHLDDIGASRGDILYRGAAHWSALPPATAGDILVTEGTGGDPMWATIAAVLDFISSVEGSVLFRSSTGWVALAPGTSGYVLTTGGAGADPAWAPTAASGVIAYFGAGAPVTLHNEGDLYFDTTPTPYMQYVQHTGAWVAVAGGGGGATTYFGSGVPSTLHNDGDLYFDTSTTPYTGYVQNLVSSGSGSAPTIVQSATGTGHSSTPTLTLGSTPTVGSLMLALITMGDSSFTLDTGWTAIDSVTTSDMCAIICYRYVQAGDTTTLPNFLTGSPLDVMIIAYEVTGVSATIGAAVDQHTMNSSAAATTLTSSGVTTGTANTLVFSMGGNQIFFGSSPTISPAGWSTDTLPGALNNASGAAHQTVGTSGTTLTPTWTWLTTPSGHNVMSLISLTGGATFTHQWELFSEDSVTLAAAEAFATSADTTVLSTAEAFSANASNLSSGTVPAARLPLASTSAFGAVKPDGTTITISSGIISATPTALPSGSANEVLATPNGSSGIASLRTLVAADIPSLSGTYLPLTGGTLTGGLQGTSATFSQNAHIGASSSSGLSAFFDANNTSGTFFTIAVQTVAKFDFGSGLQTFGTGTASDLGFNARAGDCIFGVGNTEQFRVTTKAYKSPAITVSALPSASIGVGFRAFVTDAISPVFGVTVVGGGSTPTPVYSDGTDWKVG